MYALSTASAGRHVFQPEELPSALRASALVPVKEVTFPTDSPGTFQLVDVEGLTHRVPFHRVREVYKNSQRIWHRPDQNSAQPNSVGTRARIALAKVCRQCHRRWTNLDC